MGCMHYLAPCLDAKKRRALITKIVSELKPIAKSFDAIAVSGYSMALIAPIVAYRLHKPVVLVRKEGHKTHSGWIVESAAPGPKTSLASGWKYIVIDDMIDSGETLEYIISQIKKSEGEDCVCVGVYLYHCRTPDSYEVLKTHGIEVINGPKPKPATIAA
jgi:adenine/guanine phosphoribosyltransferase-like PRPP-binding protein